MVGFLAAFAELLKMTCIFINLNDNISCNIITMSKMMYIFRVNQPLLYESFKSPYVTAILGPRRVGKSTLVEHYIFEHPSYKWVSLNMDRLLERQRAKTGQLRQMIEEAALQEIAHGQKIWVTIDEAQKCPALFDQIKILYDQYKNQNVIKFILTGSAFLELHQLSAETLAGRIELHHLREFSLREAVVLHNPNIEIPPISLFDYIASHDRSEHLQQNIIQKLQPFNKLFTHVLQAQIIWGGFPEVLTAVNDTQRNHYLSNYLQTYLEKDIRDIESISDLELYQHLMEIIAEQTGSVRDDRKVLQALGCARNTLLKYQGLLAATLLLKEIYPYINSSLKRLVKSPKIYLVSNGLVNFLTGLDDLHILEKTGLIGHRFENWFLKELQIWLDRNTKFNQIYYWRTSGGVEVDFVVQIKPKIYPFEITYSEKINDKKLKNLKQFLHEEEKAQNGFYVYMGEYRYDEKTCIHFIPAWAIG